MEYIFWIAFVSFTIFFIIKWKNFGKADTGEISNTEFQNYIDDDDDDDLIYDPGRAGSIHQWWNGNRFK